MSNGKWVELEQGRPGRGSPGAGRSIRLDQALRRRHAAPRARTRGFSALGRHHRRRRRLGGRSAPRVRRSVPERPSDQARGIHGRTSPLPGRGARLARLPRHGRPRWLSGARHGPGQDPDHAGPSASHGWQRPGSGHRPAGGGRQLGLGGPQVRSRSPSRGPPRPQPGRGPRHRQTARAGRRRDHHLRHRRSRRRRASAKIDWGKTVLDEAQAIKNATSETAQIAAHDSAPEVGWP